MFEKIFFWRGPRIGIIELRGTLAARPGALNLRGVGPLIERAFKSADKRLPYIILDIDSPGGSPVQSELIASLIRRRATETKITVHAVIQDVGASGGYWLACAADEIAAQAMSIVGSIGVVGGGFGFTRLIDRLGIQRRLYTSGENKARLDPFSPEREADVAFAHKLMDDIHTRFKEWVRLRRGAKLKAPDSELFDGSYHLGVDALALGLVDRIADLDTLAHELGGKNAATRVFRARRRGLLSRIPRLAAEATLEALDEVARPRL
jgi:signal peptide peptidase SppA